MSTISAGYDWQIYFKEEAGAYGTVANAGQWQYMGPIHSAPVSCNIERYDGRRIGSRIRLFKPALKQDDGLSMELDLQSDTNWVLLQDIDDAALKLYSLCLTATWGGTDYFVYAPGALFDEATVTSEWNTVTKLKIVWNIQRLNGVYNADQYPGTTYETPSTTEPWTWNDGKFTLDGASGWAAAPAVDTDLDEIRSFTVTIKNNYEKHSGWTNLYPRISQEKGYDVTGSFSRDLIDLNMLTEILAGNTGNILLYVAAANDITLNGVSLDSDSFDIVELEHLAEDIPFRADSVTFN